MLKSLFSGSDFVPRRLCGLWTQPLLWLHVTSDGIIFVSYMIIGLLLLKAVRLWQCGKIDVTPAQHMAPVIGIVFGSFILCCGCTHLNQVIVFYHPFYRWMGCVSALTAFVSFSAVLTLWKAVSLSTVKKGI